MENGSTNLLQAFMVSTEYYNNHKDKYPDLQYNQGDMSVHKFNQEDIDQGWIVSLWETDNFCIPATKYTPEKIFSGQVPALDINFINPKDWAEAKNEDENQIYDDKTAEAMNKKSVAQGLHQVIATWYVSLRNLAIVGLMIVLVYVGIRMVISSTASDKAKYKQLLLDWLVAMCLLFCLHYIMSFTVTFTQAITDAIVGNKESVNTIPVQVYNNPTTDSETGEITGGKLVVEFNTDLMGLARFQVQMEDMGTKILYMIIYLALVIYTVMFTFTYLKRTITIAFLTLIAPLVALTYPIDKINDGKAQAFNMWLKEYIFNALLQPFHLIIYMVFVGSAMELASNNPIYAIVALAFITPAEKILRKFFGFEKASTAGTLGAFSKMVGGAAAYKALGNAVNRSAKKSGGNNSVRTKDKKGYIEDPDSPSGLDGYTSKSQQNEKTPEEIEKEKKEQEKIKMQEALEAAQKAQEQQELMRQQQELAERQRQMEEMQRELNTINYNDDPDYYSQRQAQLEDLQRGQPLESGTQTPQPSQVPTIRTQANRGAQTTPMPSPTSRQTPTASLGENRVDKIQRVRSIKGGFAGARDALMNKASTTLGNKHWWGKTAKSALKTGTHAALRTGAALGVGALGVAAGIAGDDLEDVLTYGVGGAVLGATVGGNAVTNFADGLANSTPVQGFVEGFTGKTSTQRAIDKQEKEIENDVDLTRQVQQTYQPDGRELSGKELQEAMHRSAKLITAGIDPSDLSKALKAEDRIRNELSEKGIAQEDDKTRMQAVTAMKLSKKVDQNKLATNEKYRENLLKNWQGMIMKSNPELTSQEAGHNAEQMMKRVEKILKIR